MQEDVVKLLTDQMIRDAVDGIDREIVAAMQQYMPAYRTNRINDFLCQNDRKSGCDGST